MDETSFQKRHEYVTVINDLDGHVVHVADGRSKETLERFFQQFDRQGLADVETVAMDMWEPYIRVTGEYVPDAHTKIAFDKFHVAKHLGDAVDQVRRAEHRKLARAGDDRLKGTRYLWLTNPEHLDDESAGSDWRRWASAAGHLPATGSRLGGRPDPNGRPSQSGQAGSFGSSFYRSYSFEISILKLTKMSLRTKHIPHFILYSFLLRELLESLSRIMSPAHLTSPIISKMFSIYTSVIL